MAMESMVPLNSVSTVIPYNHPFNFGDRILACLLNIHLPHEVEIHFMRKHVLKCNCNNIAMLAMSIEDAQDDRLCPRILSHDECILIFFFGLYDGMTFLDMPEYPVMSHVTRA